MSSTFKSLFVNIFIESMLVNNMQHASILKRYAFVLFLQDQDKEYVGFATLPNQVHRKTVKKGFTFTLMVAGESSLMSTN